MAQVRIAFGASDLDTLHAMAEVIQLTDHRRTERLKIAGPAATGIVLGGGVEQRLATTDAVIDARHLAVVILPGKRPFGAAQAADVELFRRQRLTPGIQGFLDFIHGLLPSS